MWRDNMLPMSQTFAANYYHIVFSTKERRRAIADPPRMWAYLGGTVRRLGCLPVKIGGIEDHAHLLISIPPNVCVADIVGKLKANSSKWMGSRFEWQRGYSCFTVSVSQVKAVTRYIEDQPEHHKKRDYRAELISLLQKHGVAFDERYVFD